MTHLARIADLVVNRPLMVMPSKLAVIASVLDGRLGIDAGELRELAALAPPPSASQFVGDAVPDARDHRRAKPYRMTADGTAIYAIVGALINRGSWIDALSGIVAYDRIKHDITMAADDRDVFAIIIDFDSPGGEAVGAFEAADAIRDAARRKPVIAHVTGVCASAGYALASACSRIIVSQSSIVGSVGVVLLHTEISRKLDKAGISTRLIHAGARKVDGNQFEPLTDEVAAELQAEIDRFHDLFVACVARGRPGMTEKAVRATEARTYIGADAVAVGLADEVASFESVILDLGRISPLRHRAAAPGGSGCGAAGTRSPVPREPAAMIDNAEYLDILAAGAALERDRIRAVMDLPEARGREGSALHCALSGDIPRDAIRVILTSLPAGPVPVFNVRPARIPAHMRLAAFREGNPS